MSEQVSFENRLPLQEVQEAVLRIKSEIKKVIVGQDKVLDLLLTALLANGHVLIEGVPGVAKTLVAKLLSKCISTDFSRIQFTPDLMPSDVLGTMVYNAGLAKFEFNKGPVFSNLVLIDEVNRAPAKTQAALFEVMEERQVSTDGVTRRLEPPFLVLATQNPVEHEGTYRLPEAQLDRFLFKVNIDYPDVDQEFEILLNAQKRKVINELELINAVVTAEEVIRFQSIVHQVLVDENLLRYIASIIEKTRSSSALYLGASPRASLAVLNAAKAYAAIEGRDFVTPDDIKFVIIPVLHHRVILTPEKEMEGVQTQFVIRQIIDSVEVPR